MTTESSSTSRRVEYGQGFFNTAIEELDDDSKEILAKLKSQLERTPFQVIGQENGENPEIDTLVKAGLEADTPLPFIDFIILNSIEDEGDKQLRLMLIHDNYYGPLYPSHAILCASQGFDLTEGMPYGTPFTGNPPDQIAF